MNNLQIIQPTFPIQMYCTHLLGGFLYLPPHVLSLQSSSWWIIVNKNPSKTLSKVRFFVTYGCIWCRISKYNCLKHWHQILFCKFVTIASGVYSDRVGLAVPPMSMNSHDCKPIALVHTSREPLSECTQIKYSHYKKCTHFPGNIAQVTLNLKKIYNSIKL